MKPAMGALCEPHVNSSLLGRVDRMRSSFVAGVSCLRPLMWSMMHEIMLVSVEGRSGVFVLKYYVGNCGEVLRLTAAAPLWCVPTPIDNLVLTLMLCC